MEEKEFYQWLQVLVYSLQLPEWPFGEKIGREEAMLLIANFFNLNPKDPELPQKAFLKLNEILAEEKPVPNIPLNLKELVEIYEKHLKEVQEKELNSVFPTLNEEIKSLYEQYRQKILEEIKPLTPNPQLAQVISHQVALEVVSKLPSVVHEQAFEETVPPEKYQKIVQPVLQQNLAKIGIKAPPESQLSKVVTEKTRPLAKPLAATPHYPPTPPTPPPISEEIPPGVISQLTAESQGIAFKPIFTLLHPPTTVSFAKKIVLTPIVKPLQWAVKIAEEVSPEIKAIVLEGLTSKDIQESIKAFQKAGLLSGHPKLSSLKNQQEKLAEFESSHKILSFVFHHYHEFSKITGGRQIQEPQVGLFLPQLSPSPVWYQQKGYAWSLHQGLNRLGIFLRTHQWLPTPSGKKIIRFVLHDKIIRFITFGKVESFTALKTAAYKKLVQPVLIWLGKTAIGKAIKTGARKLITWGLTKLGLAVIPEPVSKILLILSLAKDFIKLVWGGFKAILRKFKEKPEAVLATGLILMAVPIFIPLLPIVGTVITTIGIITSIIGFLGGIAKWAGAIISQIGGFLSSAASAVGGFFSSLSTISLPSILPTIAVGGTVGTIAVATTVVIVTTGSAFIKEGLGERPTHIGTPIDPRAPAEAGHLAETVIWTLNQCGITAVNKTTWKKTENCLNNSNLPNKEEIINQFHFSVFEVGPGLQCVGFVRGVTAALGKELEGGRQAANGYLDPPTPSGYYPVETDMSKVQIGDLVIMKGTTYGHIGIVVNKKEGSIWVAQALGTENGRIEITEINPVYYNGFLRPK